MKARLVVVLALFILFAHDRIAESIQKIYYDFSDKGFRVDYYQDETFSESVLRKSEGFLVKNYRSKKPSFRFPSERFTARWKGWLKIREKDTYTFYLQSQGEACLYIDGKRIVDTSQSDWWREGKNGAIELEEGSYPVLLEYVKTGELSAVRVKWTGGPVPNNTVLGSPHISKDKKL